MHHQPISGQNRSDPPAPTALAWRPSIYMPRVASRITLEATDDARKKLVQDISEADAVAEGSCIRHGFSAHGQPTGQAFGEGLFYVNARECFAAAWEELNGSRDGGKWAWTKNPSVAVISFKRVV